MREFLKHVTVAACAVGLLAGPAKAQDEPVEIKDEYRFVMIPILAQAWFDIVHNAAVDAADRMGAQLGTNITIDYQAPATADLVEQNTLLERAIATQPDGIAIDAIDVDASMPILNEARDRGIPVVLYVSKAPQGSQFTYISNDFYDQGRILGEELLDRIDESGKVAILHGVPTNSAHADRYQALQDLFAEYSDVEIVDEGFDYDDVQNAQTEASRILSANPDLDAIAVVDAAGPVGVGLALQEAGRVGEVQYVGIDDVPQLQELMRQGVLDLSIATRPRMIGEWSTVTLMLQNMGFETPSWIDTGIGYLTPDLVEDGNIDGF
ncbi:substrate-binding domain-containing protein [Roseovarius sp. MMSF_3281]|uniref:substrate-binding domain-containing protein n=1 Tax=Roseovarius sp. MMSF_3281 TaxID=3046694 RepID=UPI00273F3FC6|nr:substrate-binding domain-containing protein [Roseovarius sp. MMSF_3281]